MRSMLWMALWVLAVLLAGRPGLGESDPPTGQPSPRERTASSTPIQLLGGRLDRINKGTPQRFRADCYIPGVRSGEMTCLLRVGESSLLLRADGGGRFTRVGFADLFEGNESDGFQAAVARGSDPTEPGLVSWLVVYSSPKDRPILNEPSLAPVRVTPVPSGQPESN